MSRPNNELRMNLEQLENAVNGVFWKDLKERLLVWQEDIRDQLEDFDMTESVESTERLRGSAKAIRFVLSLPGIFKQELLTNQENEDGTERDE